MQWDRPPRSQSVVPLEQGSPVLQMMPWMQSPRNSGWPGTGEAKQKLLPSASHRVSPRAHGSPVLHTVSAKHSSVGGVVHVQSGSRETTRQWAVSSPSHAVMPRVQGSPVLQTVPSMQLAEQLGCRSTAIQCQRSSSSHRTSPRKHRSPVSHGTCGTQPKPGAIGPPSPHAGATSPRTATVIKAIPHPPSLDIVATVYTRQLSDEVVAKGRETGTFFEGRCVITYTCAP